MKSEVKKEIRIVSDTNTEMIIKKARVLDQVGKGEIRSYPVVEDNISKNLKVTRDEKILAEIMERYV
jgi:hypothetical protein